MFQPGMSSLLAASLILSLFVGTLRAQNEETGPKVQDELALKQGQMADKYARLEELMLKLSSLEASENPRRAALLQRAVLQSKDRLTKTQLESVVAQLQQNQLKRAVDGQTTVQTDLKALLELLMSEDRGERIKGEKERIREYIKEVERLIRLEKSLQGQTEGVTDTKRLAQDQQNIAGRTGELVKKIRESEEPGAEGESKTGEPSSDSKEPMPGDEGKPTEGKPGEQNNDAGKPMPAEGNSEGKPGSENKPGEPKEGQPGDQPPKPGDENPDSKKPEERTPSDPMKPAEGKPAEGKPSESKPSEGKPMEGEPSEGKPAEGKPSEGKPMPGQSGEPQEGQPGESQPSGEQDQPENPARKRLEQAQQAMRDAQQKLEQARREESLADQQKAREELEKAKAELEQILRQLREEELERTLAQLEGRFRKMLEMQLRVYESTRRLDQVSPPQRGDDFVVQAGKLSFDEQKISLEAQKALTLLLEEGSSVAFPATVEQMQEDMDQVTRRLGDAKIDELTIGIEEDIIASLEEIIEALQQAQQDLEEKKQQQQQQQQQQQGEQEQPLVDQIAELKMIRALQERVNKRTNRYARLLTDDADPVGQADGAELIDALKQLSGRQQEIHRITRDIVVGKNK